MNALRTTSGSTRWRSFARCAVIWRGRIVSGASTLTMPLARLLEPKPRTLASKLFETWRAAAARTLGRQRVLANYLRFLL